MPSEEDNSRLMWAILSQKTKNGKLTDVDWAKVADDLGIAKPHTAYCRWDALYKNLRARGLPGTTPAKEGASPAKSSAPKKSTPKKPKTANPKARSAVTKPRATTKGGKTAKDIDQTEDEDDDEGADLAAFKPEKTQGDGKNGMDLDAEDNVKQEHDLESVRGDIFYDAEEPLDRVDEA